MTLPLSHKLPPSKRNPRIGMNATRPDDGRRIAPPVKKCYRFPYFIKGVPPQWLNPPPSVRLFRPFDALRLKLELEMIRMKHKKRRP